MHNLPSRDTLQKIAEPAHVPAVAYAYVEPKDESKREFASTPLSFGTKNAESTDAKVDDHTRFPASS